MPTARLTRSDIERKLLAGLSVTWKDSNGKNCQFALNDPKERRLFSFLISSKVREPTGLSQDFIDGLSSAYGGTDDPASKIISDTTAEQHSGPWRLQSIAAEGFGGLNIWGRQPFNFDFDQQSLLIEGPNGSGKSSLIGAILWALSGERPRDQASSYAHEPKPVFGPDDKLAGNWPSIASYPLSAADLKLPPRVSVQLTFQDPKANSVGIERSVDGSKVTLKTDPGFEVPSIFLETGLMMPARLAHIRFNEGGGRLTDAVQKLTGLDELAAIGMLVAGLCHGSREYLTYKRKDMAIALKEFTEKVASARDALATVEVTVPDFTIAHTEDDKSEMAIFGKTINTKAAELTQVVSSDLASGLDLANSTVRNQVTAAIIAAQEELQAGIEGLPSWKSLQLIAHELDERVSESIKAGIITARSKADDALRFQERSSKDSKFQLKAVAAQWHNQHISGTIANCPLCNQDLKEVPLLVDELEELRSTGEAAARKFSDNLNAITAELESLLPVPLKKFGLEILTLEPQAKLTDELRTTYVLKERYSGTLVRFKELVEAALTGIPESQLNIVPLKEDSNTLKGLNEKIAILERLIDLAAWFRTKSDQWVNWWKKVAIIDEIIQEEISQQNDTSTFPSEKQPERLAAHLSRLSEALAKAEPYRKAAESMRKAWTSGKLAKSIGEELKRRDAIAASLAPLKNLTPLSEFVTREAINGLSDRIAKLLKQIHITEQLQFHDARLQRKEGLVVRGAFVPDMRIDATLVANTSWLRAVLWAFLFALREEAVEQVGTDPFPLLLFDDPQLNFDAEHRHRWGEYIASLQTGQSKAQIILTTYDEMFLDLIKVNGVTGRQAMIVSAGAENGHVNIFEGESLTRKWTETQELKTPKAGRDYIGKVRECVEGLMRLMLRGEDATVRSAVSGFVVGDCREKLCQLNAKGIAPWDRPQFKKLVNLLGKNEPSIKYMEIAHHSGGINLGMAEATDVEKHWRKSLRPTLENCFRQAREHHLLHGGFKALHAGPVSVTLPEGYSTKVQTIPLQVLGRAAALSDGRMADGRFDLDEFSLTAQKKITLAHHLAYRLTAQTLEPVARPGDLLLVKKPGEPPAKSLVIALSEGRILARRFDIAENHSDVAVLTAQAINPRQIAPPVIAHKSTFTLYQIIGVIFEEKAWGSPTPTDMEICECTGTSLLPALAMKPLGLVEVVGQSAEPHALNGQYLIVSQEISVGEALDTLDGKPIIACDTDDNRYFKRLRIPSSDQIVLESLDGGGYHGPVALYQPGKGKNCLERVWPVVGVLFELPN